jgi:parallel beta-helix repeat protein
MKIMKVLFIVLGVFFGISASAWSADLLVNVAGPSGGDDTALVQSALDQCIAHGPGCTVQLAAGTYKSKQLLAENFHGTFKGMGMDITTIQALTLLGNPNPSAFNDLPSASNPYPNLITFLEGDITVTDMTLKALEINAVAGWRFHESDVEPLTYMWAILDFLGQSAMPPMNVVVTRVATEGIYDESQPAFHHYSASAGIQFEAYPTIETPTPGQLPGTFLVSACRMMNTGQGVAAALLHKARVTVGGSPSEGNLIKNCEVGLFPVDLDASTLDYSHNDVTVVGPLYAAGIGAFQVAYSSVETPSSFTIQHNQFKVKGSYGQGVWIVDYGPPSGLGKKGDFIVSNNTITIEPSANGPAYAGIQTDFSVGTVISNNRIVGSGLFGISIEGDTQCMVKGNNVNGVTAEVASIGLLTNWWFAPAFFPANNCTVLGSGNKTNVYADPEGYNNIVVGVNNMQGNPPDPDIRDAMKHKAEMIKSLRKR